MSDEHKQLLQAIREVVKEELSPVKDSIKGVSEQVAKNSEGIADIGEAQARILKRLKSFGMRVTDLEETVF